MSVRLVLVRHGDATAPPGRGYDAATLTAQGRAEARAVGRLLRRIGGSIEAILTSPLPRAQETAEAIRTELVPGPAPIVAIELQSGAITRDWTDSIEIYARGAASVLGVGHAPEIGAIAAELAGGARVLPFPTGSAACVELGPTGGRLRWYLPASAIAALTRDREI